MSHVYLRIINRDDRPLFIFDGIVFNRGVQKELRIQGNFSSSSLLTPTGLTKGKLEYPSPQIVNFNSGGQAIQYFSIEITEDKVLIEWRNVVDPRTNSQKYVYSLNSKVTKVERENYYRDLTGTLDANIVSLGMFNRPETNGQFVLIGTPGDITAKYNFFGSP